MSRRRTRGRAGRVHPPTGPTDLAKNTEEPPWAAARPRHLMPRAHRCPMRAGTPARRPWSPRRGSRRSPHRLGACPHPGRGGHQRCRASPGRGARRWCQAFSGRGGRRRSWGTSWDGTGVPTGARGRAPRRWTRPRPRRRPRRPWSRLRPRTRMRPRTWIGPRPPTHPRPPTPPARGGRPSPRTAFPPKSRSPGRKRPKPKPKSRPRPRPMAPPSPAPRRSHTPPPSPRASPPPPGVGPSTP